MLSLKQDELSYRNGVIAGFQQAHEPAACGHARGNWKDPKYGTPEYSGDERCEVCELEKQVAHWKANHAECVRRKRVKDTLTKSDEWREQIRKGAKHE